MPQTPTREPALPTGVIAIFGLLLLAPLLELPRPALITTTPWKVELLVSIFLLIGLVFARKLTRSIRPPYSLRTIVTLLCLFAAWSGISFFWASNSGAVVHHTLVWATYIVFFLVTIATLRSTRGISPVGDFAATLASILGVLCILDFVTVVDFSASEGTLRIRWAKYAELLVTILPFLWAIGCYLRGRKRAIALLIGIVGWTAAMLSLSRSAFISGLIGFVILFVLVIIFSRPRHRLAMIKMAAVWIVLTIGFQLGSAYLTSIPATTQYISGSADPTRSTATMRIFTWSVTGSMIKAAPVLGVGADNFGAAFNDSRTRYGVANPEDPNNAIGEDYLFERAHNEYLQIAAELGIPGLMLILAAFFLFGARIVRSVWANRGRVSPALIGAIAGMSAFAVSSLFTSFSFRAFQNGLAFFAMAAVAAYLASKGDRDRQRSSRFMPLMAIAATFGLAIFSALAGASQVFSTIGERQTTPIETKQNFERALVFYPENGGTQLSLASAEAKNGDYRKAADLTRMAIENGVGASIAYAKLAEYEERAGDQNAAVWAVEDGIGVFPRSSYLRAYLVLLLERTGNTSRSELEMSRARDLDHKQANGWYALIKHGSKDAYQMSRQNPNVAGPAELLPQNAIFQYLNEDLTP